MEIITKINWVDVLILIIIIRTTYVAFQDGLSREIFPLIGAACMVMLSLHYYGKLAFVITQNAAGLPMAVVNFLCFAALVIATDLYSGY